MGIRYESLALEILICNEREKIDSQRSRLFPLLDYVFELWKVSELTFKHDFSSLDYCSLLDKIYFVSKLQFD